MKCCRISIIDNNIVSSLFCLCHEIHSGNYWEGQEWIELQKEKPAEYDSPKNVQGEVFIIKSIDLIYQISI